MTWVIGAALALIGVTALGMFVHAVRSAAVNRHKAKAARRAVERMEAARDVHNLPPPDPDRVADYWDGMRDDD